MSDMVKRGHLGGNIRNGDPETFEPNLWRHLVETYDVETVLDVGCGRGHAISEFQMIGCNAFGVDGLSANAWKEGVPIVVHDYCNGPLPVSNIDLIWCCEFVEHVERDFVHNFLETFKGAKIVAMTYGTGSGYHHVNIRSEIYWIRKVCSAGFKLMKRGTRIARRMAEHRFFQEHGLLFQRRW